MEWQLSMFGVIGKIKAYWEIKKIIGGFTMKNWKTTASGLLSASGTLLPQFGVSVDVANAISVLGLALLGYFSKDHNVTGGTVEQGK